MALDFGACQAFQCHYLFFVSTAPLSVRTSFPFYAETARELQRLETALRKRDTIADRTDIIRALVHETPENAILARGILRDMDERSPTNELGNVTEFAPVRLAPKDLEKLERVAERLKKIDLKVSRGTLVRGLIMAELPIEKLEAVIKSYWNKFPDGRALRWQAPKA